MLKIEPIRWGPVASVLADGSVEYGLVGKIIANVDELD